MIATLNVKEDRCRRMNALSERIRGTAPDCHLASADWWEIHAEETKNSQECIFYAKNLRLLAHDMKNRPEYYSRKQPNQTDWKRFSNKQHCGAIECDNKI